jgi:hypothetical protein
MRCANIFLFSFFILTSAQAQSFAWQEFDQLSSSTRSFFAANAQADDFMQESCPSFEYCKDYNYHQKIYRFRGDAVSAFEQLIEQTGINLWNDGSSKFELVFDPLSENLKDKFDRDLPSIELGQVYFLELNIVKLMKIPVAFKIVELDRENLRMAFSYLKNNKSRGIQRLSFVQKNNSFHIIHETRFQSDSKMRDALLYRPFHTLLLDDFYQNFEQIIFE